MTSLKLSNYSLFFRHRHGQNELYLICCCSVAKSRLTLCHSMDYSTPGFPVHQPSPGVCSNSCPLNQWCHPTNHLILYRPLLLLPSILPSISIFPISLASGSQSIRASASASILPKNIQGWFPLRLTDWISLLSKRHSRVFSTPQLESINSSVLAALWSNYHIHTWLLGKNRALATWTFVSKVMSLLFNILSRFVITFLPRSKHLLVPWLQSPSAVILEPKKINIVTCFHCFPIYFLGWDQRLWS